MNSNLINPKFDAPAQSKAQLLKLIILRIGSLNLALQIEFVKKVVNQTAIYSSGLNSMGVTHLGDREITVVDLHRHLFKSTPTSASTQSGYLMIVQNSKRELFGIPVAGIPTLIEVPLSKIRALPESYRRADTLEIASHVTVIPQETAPLTIFLLDVERLLPTFSESETPQ